MANIDFPSGLRVIANPNGDAPRVQLMDCVSTVLYKGALALLSSTGLVSLMTSSVITSTLAKRIIGVFVEHKAAGAHSTDGGVSKTLVYTDPNQLYVIQSDDATLASPTNYVGRNFPLIGMSTGSTLGDSAGEIDGDAGSSATTSSVACVVKVIREYSGRALDGDLTANGKFIVQINPKFHLLANNGGV